jgi:hypothetical protein
MPLPMSSFHMLLYLVLLHTVFALPTTPRRNHIDGLLSLDRNDWMLSMPSKEISNSTHFRVLAFAFHAESDLMVPPPSKLLSLAVHGSANQAHHVAHVAASSDSVISFAVLAVKSIGASFALLQRLRECSLAVRRLVTFHVLFAETPNMYDDFDPTQPAMSFRQLLKASQHLFSSAPCSDVLTRGFGVRFKDEAMYESKGEIMRVRYPFNVLCQTAVENVHLPYVALIDIDLVPLPHLGAAVAAAVALYPSERRVAFVVPSLLCISCCELTCQPSK